MGAAVLDIPIDRTADLNPIINMPVVDMPADEPAPDGWTGSMELTDTQKKLLAAVKARTTSILTSDLARMDIPKVSWLVDGWVQTEGVAVVGGDEKVGKSYFVLGLAAAVAKGEPFLGRKTKQTGVIYCDLDHPSRERYNARMQQICGTAEPDHIVYVSVNRGKQFARLDDPGFTTTDMLAGLRLQQKYEHGIDVGLIIIDVYAGIMSTRSRGLDTYKEGRIELDPLVQWAHDEGVMVILVHHNRKMRDVENPFNALSGSKALSAAAEALLLLKRPVGASSTELWTRSNDAEGDGHYQLAMDNGVFRMAGEVETEEAKALKEYYKDIRRRMIVELVKRYGRPKGRLGSLKGMYEDLIGEPIEPTPKAISQFLKEHRSEFYNLDQIDWKYRNNVFEFYKIADEDMPGGWTDVDAPTQDLDEPF